MTKILLVEDNEMNRDMMARRLQKQGYEVVLAVHGEEALVKARTDSGHAARASDSSRVNAGVSN